MGAVVGRSGSVWLREEKRWTISFGPLLLIALLFSVFKLVRVSLSLEVDVSGFYMRVFKSSV